MSTFNTIHVFGFGDVQVIDDATNKIVKADDLSSLLAFVDHIKALRPQGVADLSYHVIHVFNGASIRYLADNVGDDSGTFSLEWSEIDPSFASALADEVKNKTTD